MTPKFALQDFKIFLRKTVQQSVYSVEMQRKRKKCLLTHHYDISQDRTEAGGHGRTGQRQLAEWWQFIGRNVTLAVT